MVYSGSDFTSFIAGVGKATFFKALYRYSTFIPQDLEQTSHLAFVRPLLCAYYIRYKQAFINSPADVFVELCGEGFAEDQHKAFHAGELKAIWPRTTSEESCVPGWTALQLYWQRSSWVHKVWSQAADGAVAVPDISSHGWTIGGEGRVHLVWDTLAWRVSMQFKSRSTPSPVVAVAELAVRHAAANATARVHLHAWLSMQELN